MYFFLPFMTIGVFIWLRQHSQKMGSKFFVTTFIFLNIAVLVLRYCCVSPDLSTRYALPLTSLTVFFVPDGLEAAGVWIQRMFGRKSISEDNTKQWFLVLLTIGLITCIPKLLTPIRDEKTAYLQAADWLKTNTTEQDRIVAFDIRIGFYAQRNAAGTPENGANYVAKKIKGYEKPPKDMIEAWSMYLSDRGNGDKLVIYRRIAQ